MGLFQQSVLEKYLKQLDDNSVKEAYKKFQDYFHNPDRQANIRAAKEEQFQEGFLRELFVKILGYTINPEPDYNLTSEFKNENGAKKADGAILADGKAIGVIELKGTDTKDLDKINTQAFSYKNNQSSCIYVITSNFEKLRFFIHNAVDHEEFNLFELTEDKFKLLWVCLQKDNLLAGIPEKIKEESLLEEEKVTKSLYADYSSFKHELWQDMVKRNPEYEELLLFKKSQKLLDRFLFILFSEDKGLLPPNSISEIVNQWQDLKELDEYRPLYDRYKKYFGYMNKGFKGKKYEIPAYNGGLFCEDEVLDSVKIDDEVLRKHTMKLTEYDFNTDVDVNILGHIFEHSLSEIENVRAQLEGIEVDKSKSKRKKDGVFYTPKYITKYIVDNTVGKLCEEKKESLGITDERFREAGKRTRKGIQDLEEYRKWLSGLTICDPACGSGAFLNQALSFLINEHSWLDELVAEYHGSKIVFPDVEKHILENNLYGVDINEESIEIAKLSLWLRTAKQGRKLTTLSDNIKCGNSLIDDPAVAGDKAFNWAKEFSEIFAKGGFDVVIGNPPYVRQEFLGKIKKDLIELFPNSGNGTADLYVYFYELAYGLVKDYGIIGYITPNKWFKTKYGAELRDFLKDKKIIEIIDFFELNVFEDASTEPQIFISRNSTSDDSFLYSPIKEILDFQTKSDSLQINKSDLKKSEWIFLPSDNSKLLKKLYRNSVSLKEYTGDGIKLGIKTALNKAFIIDKKTKEEIICTDPTSEEIIEDYANATDIRKWHLENKGQTYLINTGYEIPISLESYPGVYNHLNKFYYELIKRQDQGKTPYNLRACDYYDSFRESKIIFIHTAVNHYFYFDEEGVFVNNNSYIISKCDSVISLILNSQVFQFIKMNMFGAFGDLSKRGRARLNHEKMSRIPIPDSITHEHREYAVNNLIKLKEMSRSCFKIQANMTSLIESKFGYNQLSKRIVCWHEQDFAEFLKELEKARNKAAKENGTEYIKLTLPEEAEWMEYFNEQKQKITELRQQISKIDGEIDQLVYDLYGLTEEEIKIVEES